MKKRAKATDKAPRVFHNFARGHSPSSPYMNGSRREAAFGRPLFLACPAKLHDPMRCTTLTTSRVRTTFFPHRRSNSAISGLIASDPGTARAFARSSNS